MNNNNKKTNYRTGKRFTKAQLEKDAEKKRKYCPFHKEYHPISEFGKNKGKTDGLQSFCKKAMSEIKTEAYFEKRNKEKNKDQDQTENYIDFIEKFKFTKKQEISKGLICAECGVYFQCSHGMKVICLSCYHHLKIRNPQRLPEYKLAWLPEIEPVNMYDDRQEVARMNGINRIKMYEQS